ncbi:aspartyl protease family protein [Aquimarina sp. AU474]|uniref:aspartyl protease family protein n=1 Tax=Aquimarina sp. AU474 TaxID=2108529 RepID=UPI0013585D9D|nr:aspartyl protease family protein [Aquimarina sp. AU474]
MKAKVLFVIIFLCSTTFFGQKKFCDTIPFRNDLGLIIIPITYNGQEKNFIFDTGASYSIGFSWVKDELKATNKTKIMTSSSKSKFKLRYYKTDSVTLGSAKITKHRILGTKDSDIFSCYGVDGVLGMDIMANFNWHINFKDQYIVMLDSDYFPPNIDSEMHALDFVYENRRPWAFFDVLGERIQFLLDTGATNSDIYIRYKNIFKNLDASSMKEVHSGFFDFNGIFSKTKSRTMKIPEITSKSVKLTPIMDFSKKNSKIGNSSWEDASLFISVKNDKLYCSTNHIVESLSSYGCSFTVNANKIIVSKIQVNSIAWEEGLRQGSEVLEINGKRFDNFCNIYTYQKEIAKQKNKLNVTLKDGKTITLNHKLLFE